MNEDERAARIAALDQQLVRTVEGHVDSLDERVAAAIALTALLSATVSVALRSTGFDADKAHEMLRDAPWGELVLAELDDLRMRGRLP